MRVLVVEDEKKVASLIVGGLAEHGIAAVAVHQGEEALARLGAEAFDTVILDIMLPGPDGLSILRRLRADKNKIPVLLLSARGDVGERIEGLNLGADDYLPKPFVLAELIARLRAIWRRHEGASTNVLSLGGLVMNLITREVRRDGTAVSLTPREFALLECLLRVPDKVVTRTELIQQVWGYQFDPGTNVVEVAVQRLRRKVDEEFSPPLIHTVRGVGYVMKGGL